MADQESEERGATTARPDDVVFGGTSFIGMTISVGLIGATTAAFGTLLVGIAHHFHVALASAGLTLTVSFGGAVVGVALCWWALDRVAGGPVLSAALALFAVGMGVAALAPSWPLFLGAVAFSGVGFGAIDFGGLSLVSRTAREGRASRLSVSGAGWAFGAIIGPLCIVVLRPARFQLFLGLAAVVGVALIVLVRGVAAPVVHPEVRQSLTEGRRSNRRAVLWTFLTAFGCYVALETAVSGWLATQLHGWGYPSAIGSLVTAGFWAGLALGRLGASPMLRLLPGHRLVLLGLAASVALLLLASIRWAAPFAYPLVGVTLALVFPLGLHWFTELSPDDHSGVLWLVLVGMIGGSLGSAVENVSVARFGLDAVPFVAAAMAALCLLVFAGAARFPPVDAHDGLHGI